MECGMAGGLTARGHGPATAGTSTGGQSWGWTFEGGAVRLVLAVANHPSAALSLLACPSPFESSFC